MIPISVLLQTVALSLADDVELRRVQSGDTVDLEAESRPLAGLALSYPKGRVAAEYAPTLFAGPLESKSRDFMVLHSVRVLSDLSFGEGRTTFSLTLNAAAEQRNPRRDALSIVRGTDPGGGPTSGTGGAGATPASGASGGAAAAGTAGTGPAGLGAGTDVVPGTVRLGRAQANARVRRALSTTTGVAVGAGYEASGGLNDESRATYPRTDGPRATTALDTALSRRTGVASTLEGSLTRSDRNRGWLLGASETISHQLSRQTNGSLGGGAAYFRNEPADAPVQQGVTPTATASLDSNVLVSRGKLQSRFQLAYSPVLDPQTTKLDPRFRTTVLLTWVRNSLSLSIGSEGALSASPKSSSDVQGIRASGTVAYDLGTGFVASTGARGGWQRARGTETLPPSTVVFIAIGWSKVIPFR